MRILTAALVAGALAAVPAAAADQARSRDDAAKSGSSAEAGARHTPSPSAVPRSQAPPSGNLTTAERRHPRAGTGTGDRYPGGRSGYVYGRDPYRGSYYGLYGRHYYYPSYYGWGYWGAPYGVAGYYSHRLGYTGSLRLLVDPKQASVYVDGYYTGVVDDFDGIFQRLRLSPGRHEISLSLEGYLTHRLQVYVRPDQTLKIRHQMVPGQGEDAPAAYGPPPPGAGQPRADSRWDDRPAAAAPRPVSAEPAAAAPPGPDHGGVTLRIDPADASVYVDGEFQGVAGELGSLDLTPGPHRIEIVRPGYRILDREVEVVAGEAFPVTARLDPL